MILIAATGWDGEAWAARLRAALPDYEVAATGADGALPPGLDVRQVRYLLAWNTPQAIIDAASGLRLLVSLGAGVDHLLSRRLPAGVPVVRIVDPDLTARMAEYVTWQVLHHHRQGFFYAARQREHRWVDPGQWPAGAVTVGILGLGVLGTAAADILVRLGFRVRGWSRTGKQAQGVETFRGPEQLDRFLAGTDILVSLLPLTPDTAGMIGRTVFARLRRDGPLGAPVFINAGRGRTHVEAEVIEALQDGTLAGASLDVFEREPLPADSPLWDMPNVVITPHAAAESNPDGLAAQIAAQIRACERGEPLSNVVDLQRGY